MPTLTSLRLFVVAAFAVCIFARMRLPVCEHQTVTFVASSHGSLLRAKFQSVGEIESTRLFEAVEVKIMIEIRYVQTEDKEFWYSLDRHLPEPEFENKVSNKRGYIIFDDNKPIGLLRYNLFWDNTPFCTMLFIDWNYQGKGYGKKLMEHWEADMKSQGYGMLLTSTQVDEEAQHFYRKLGYKDCGGFVIDIPGYEQPMEMFFIKCI